MRTLSPTVAALIVCEAAPQWSIAWRRALRGMDVDILETRALAHCAAALEEHPRSLVSIEVSQASLPRLLPSLDLWRRNFPAAAFLILADRKLRIAEPFLREAGAFHVLYSRREIPQAVRFVRRHLGESVRGRETAGKPQ